jgi:glutamate 5-kinase
VNLKMKTLVVKIGTSTLVKKGVVEESYIAGLARQVAQLREDGTRVVIVSSGAVRLGLDTIGRERATRLPEKQAAAAVGQSLLMRAYRRAFNEENLHVAQLLLTRSDISDRRRFLNARHTMCQLFEWGVVPIVNENDTVAVEEIRFGDNDTLAALTALVAEAEQCLLLSDIDGFYLPGEKKPMARIEKITKEIEEAAGGAGSIGGTGGMRTKIEAARIAMQAGIELVIAHGREREIVRRVAQGENIGTHFLPRAGLRGRKRWIAFGRSAQGALLLNDRAREALLEKGSSLLPIGIIEVQGNFDSGALVSVRDSRGEYARGLTNYSADDLRRIAGQHTSEIAATLGRADFKEAIHRDNLTLLESAKQES